MRLVSIWTVLQMIYKYFVHLKRLSDHTMYEVDSSAPIQIQTLDWHLTPVRPILLSISLLAKYCNITLYCQLFVFVMSPVTLSRITPHHLIIHHHHTHFYFYPNQVYVLSFIQYTDASFTEHSFGQIVKKDIIIIGSAAKDTNCHANVITKSRIMNCAAREWMDEVSMDLVYQPPPPLTSNVKL